LEKGITALETTVALERNGVSATSTASDSITESEANVFTKTSTLSIAQLRLSGTIKDGTGAVLADASIKISGDLTVNLTSDANGKYATLAFFDGEKALNVRLEARSGTTTVVKNIQLPAPSAELVERVEDVVIVPREPGTLAWSVPQTARDNSAVGADGTIYSLFDNQLVALNPDGTQKWRKPLNATTTTSPVVIDDGSVLVGAISKLIRALPDGSIQVTNLPNVTIQSLTALKDGVLIGSDATNGGGQRMVQIRFWSPTNGLIWTKTLPGFSYESQPVVGTDGTIYLEASGNLFAINGDGKTLEENSTNRAFARTGRWSCPPGRSSGPSDQTARSSSSSTSTCTVRPHISPPPPAGGSRPFTVESSAVTVPTAPGSGGLRWVPM
jgi:PQQ-like domain